MLGWEIHIINNNTKVEYGDWLGGLGATKWIDRLVDAGKAEKIYQVASSYYLIKAKDLIPEIAVIEAKENNPTPSFSRMSSGIFKFSSCMLFITPVNISSLIQKTVSGLFFD